MAAKSKDYTGPIAYLWIATQSEPGCTGEAYRLTSDRSPPERIKPSRHYDQNGNETDLVYEDSLYDDWDLLGTVKGKAVVLDDGETGVEFSDGSVMQAVYVVVNRRYTRTKH